MLYSKMAEGEGFEPPAQSNTFKHITCKKTVGSLNGFGGTYTTVPFVETG